MDRATVVERMGEYWADSGRTPMRGRVFGYLLASPAKDCDFESIRLALDASKSAVSLALSGLTDQRLVRAHTRPGSRRRYFSVDIDGWLGRSKREMRGVAELNDILRGCRHLRESAQADYDPDPLTDPLGVMISFHDGFLRQVEAFFEIWDDGRP